MNIYLIRHGETALNKLKIHQKPETELSEQGLHQVREIVQMINHESIDHIFSSPLKRALQTAEILAHDLHLKYEVSDSLKEIQRPSAIVGKSHDNEEVIQIKKEINDHAHIPDWKHSDEENFTELKKRVSELKDWLTKQNYQNVILVSHGIVIKMFLALIKYGETLNPEEFLTFYRETSVTNVGVTLCRYENTTWEVVYTNKITRTSISAN